MCNHFQDPSLHDQLADVYVDQLTECAADETTSKLWRAKGLLLLTA